MHEHEYEGPERRQSGFSLSDYDIERISAAVAGRIKADHACLYFSQEEVQTIKSLLHTKKSVMKATLWVIAAFAAWAVRDIWIWLAKSISIAWNGK